MNIYKIQNGVMMFQKPARFDLEKQMQELIENNLAKISELKLIKSEFAVKNKRIDTLAFNSRLNAFVIIEYKRGINYSVVDQGVAYLKFMLENKAEFLAEYNEKRGSALRRKDIRWKNSYVIFAAPGFTDNQLCAAGYKDLRIILWIVKLFGDSIIAISEISNDTPDPADEVQEIKQVDKHQSWHNDPLWNEIKILGKRA